MESTLVEMQMPDGNTDVVGVHPSIAEAWSKPVEIKDGEKAERPECRILNDKEAAEHKKRVQAAAATQRAEAEGQRQKEQRELVKDVVSEILKASKG